MATLTPAQRFASRALGLLLSEASAGRLKLHGFVPDGFGCVVRDDGAPLSHARALSICVDEAAEPVGVASGEGRGEAEGEVEQHQGEAGEVHASTVAPATGCWESDR